MNRAILLALALATTASAQIQLVPDNRVSVHTNNMIYLTNTVLQGDMAIIDTNLFKLYAADVVLSNRITNVSNLVVGASNRAEEAYTLALNATNSSPSQQTYVYTVSNTVTLVAGTSGQTTFTVGTQDLARIHVGQYLGPTNYFSGAATQLLVSAVDRTSGSNLVTITGGGSLRTTTNNVTVTVTNAGSLTHTVPTGYSRCRVTVTGGGGSGGLDNNEAANAGSGGGAGGTAIAYLRLASGDAISVTAGKCGARKTSGGAGNAGTTSSFGSICSATGGGAGAGPSDNGGAGGIGAGGAINVKGGSGEQGNGSGETSFGGVSVWGGLSSDGTESIAPYGAGGTGGTTEYTPDNNSQAGDGIVVVEYY
jgi:hypothetical protein